MPIEAMPLDSEVSVIVDWFEIAVLASPNRMITLGEVKNQIELQRDGQSDDWSDEDQLVEEIQANICAKVRQRGAALGKHYPFEVSPDGMGFLVRDPLGAGGAIYVFCLIVAQANASELLSGSLVPQLSNRDRDLFQGCATLCAAGALDGAAIS